MPNLVFFVEPSSSLVVLNEVMLNVSRNHGSQSTCGGN
jgi:hypothetical protein